MQADSSQLLAQLRDIHATAPPSWWPPAPGWWVLAALVLVLLFLAVRYLAGKLRDHHRRRRYLSELDRLTSRFDPEREARQYLAGLNRLFRAVAMRAFPDTACASLQGDDWVTFIRSLLPGTADSSGLSALAHGPYQPVPDFDRQALIEHARTWVKLYG